MGETRDPAKGSWSIFEGGDFVTSTEDSLRYRDSVNRELVWPVSLRVHYIRNGVMESRDVEIKEDLSVTVRKHDRYDLASGD